MFKKTIEPGTDDSLSGGASKPARSVMSWLAIFGVCTLFLLINSATIWYGREPSVSMLDASNRMSNQSAEGLQLFRSTAHPTTCNLLILVNCFAQLLTWSVPDRYPCLCQNTRFIAFMSLLESNAVRPRMNGVCLAALAARDTPSL